MNPKIVLRLALVAALHAVACASTHDASQSSAVSAGTVDDDYAKMVGRWQFVYDDARRSAVEAELTKSISDPTQLAAAKKEAEDEAAASTIELAADHGYRSLIGDKVVFHDRCLRIARGATPGAVECAAGTTQMIDGKPSMRLEGDELVMTDPRRGDLRFRRIR